MIGQKKEKKKENRKTQDRKIQLTFFDEDQSASALPIRQLWDFEGLYRDLGYKTVVISLEIFHYLEMSVVKISQILMVKFFQVLAAWVTLFFFEQQNSYCHSYCHS